MSRQDDDLDPAIGFTVAVVVGLFAWIGFFVTLRWVRDLITPYQG
jgi:hypothetical protein